MEETLTLQFDGGSRGNPGPAGIGVVVAAEDGTPLVTLGRYIGRATNNVAEYRALIAAMQEALKLGAKRIVIRGDSELIIKQMRGEYRVKNPDMRVLYQQAQELLARFEQARIEHNLRHKNALADRLANLAINRKGDVDEADSGGQSAGRAVPMSRDESAPRAGPLRDRSNLLTEQRLVESMRLDTLAIEDAVELMNRQDARAAQAVATQRDAIAAAVRLAAEALKNGGRLIYVGAGTSGRLGVLDAAECPPTFSTDPRMVQGIIAGGREAVFRSVEGAEDDANAGAAAMDDLKVGDLDVVMGIAAGGTTPFVHAALNRAIARGSRTIFLTCVEPLPEEPKVDVIIRPLTGPEVLTGSTRLKAGTATKLVLNTISTLAMVQLGKVVENLMVDLRASNDKLTDRAVRLVSLLTGLGRQESLELLHRAGGHVKEAVRLHREMISTDGRSER